MAYKLTKKQVIEAVRASEGTYVSVAKLLKMQSSMTAKKYVEMYPEAVEEFNKIQDLIVDKAETVVVNNLNHKNPYVSMRAAEFILKYLPRSRWKEAVSQTTNDKLIDLLNKMIDNAEK